MKKKTALEDCFRKNLSECKNLINATQSGISTGSQTKKIVFLVQNFAPCHNFRPCRDKKKFSTRFRKNDQHDREMLLKNAVRPSGTLAACCSPLPTLLQLRLPGSSSRGGYYARFLILYLSILAGRLNF